MFWGWEHGLLLGMPMIVCIIFSSPSKKGIWQIVMIKIYVRVLSLKKEGGGTSCYHKKKQIQTLSLKEGSTLNLKI